LKNLGFLKTLLNYLDTIAPLLPIVVFVVSKTKIKGGQFLLFYLILQLLLNGLANFMAIHERNNIFIYQVNSFLSLILISLYYLKLFRHEKQFKSILFFTVIFSLIQMFISINENTATFDSKGFSLTSLIIIIFSLVYFAARIIDPTTIHLTKTSSFWIVTGLFTYYASNFFIFTLFAYYSLNNEPTILGLLWRIHNCIFLVMTLYLSKGFLCKDYLKI